ncbi:transposable element Tcb1 transposase [Trichonephila clavipes]|uniref:Transposable element Tcb1 transposase n=1 Tax=Trichonephila clavipes TaxID=2585209 RepID=A0A8X6WLU3_TRICX|nr:transposable element Tcb1 transposase [Trichonephila clavipes]
MSSQIYRDIILEQHLRLLRGTIGAEFVFMDDNARSNHESIEIKYLKSEDITRMDWAELSSGLNPVEYVGDILDQRVLAGKSPPTCLPELRRALLDEWCNIPQPDQIYNLILSVPRHHTDCIASSGRHTLY